MLEYKVYGLAHRLAKRVLRGKEFASGLRFQQIEGDAVENFLYEKTGPGVMRINDRTYEEDSVCLNREELFCGDNVLENCRLAENGVDSAKPQNAAANARDAWKCLLENAKIPPGFRNSGFYRVGYTKRRSWCLSSWIWTSAAVCRYLIAAGKIAEACAVADAFLKTQLDCGGWIVRFDFEKSRTVPVLAPNDSAYIANNALLECYFASGDKKYLAGARKTADWIMCTAREDGLVSMGYDNASKTWMNEKNIVDTGFTAALFARLVKMGESSEYEVFLRRFVNAYIAAFYKEEQKAFSTAIDQNGRQFGGFFARGQAWALEGLIPANEVLRDENITQIIGRLIEFLIKNQNADGSWPYNFAKPLMGEDCKGVPVITYALLKWRAAGNGDDTVLQSVQKALRWCEAQTELAGACTGGIFSYTVEGAVAHSLYTSTAFVYATAYALEATNLLEEETRRDSFK